jgi:nitroreductase
MESNSVISAILMRRSIRSFSGIEVPNEIMDTILEAGRWAPSGLNNQPWRFVIIRDPEIRGKLSKLTHYGGIIKDSNVCLAVYFHRESGYDRDKDLMAIGACIENMLLAAQSLGLGAVWLGEILNKREAVNQLLGISTKYELMAVISLGYPDESPAKDRIDLNELILKRM